MRRAAENPATPGRRQIATLPWLAGSTTCDLVAFFYLRCTPRSAKQVARDGDNSLTPDVVEAATGFAVGLSRRATARDGDVAVELTCSRDLDVGVLVGSHFTPTDVLNLAINITKADDVAGSPTLMSGALAHRLAGDATNDSTSRCKSCGRDMSGNYLSLWLYDDHANVASGIGGFVNCSHRSGAGWYCGPRTTGVDVPSTPTKSARLASKTPC